MNNEAAQLTVIIPARDECARLPDSLRAVRAWLDEELPELTRQGLGAVRLLVMDDGSRDGTATAAREAAAACGLELELHTRNGPHGKGATLREGVARARGDWFLLVDADLAIPLSEFGKLWALRASAPLVIGSKHDPAEATRFSLLRRLGSRVGNLLIQLLAVPGIKDTQCGFKLLRAEVARELFADTRLDGFGYDFEVLMMARQRGYAIREVPVRCADPGGGSVGLGAYLRTLRELLQVCWGRLRGQYRAGAGSAG